jgi:hypothetical protein
MQIHKQGNTVRLIRSGREPNTPRARQTLVGTFHLDHGPDRALLDRLDDDERARLDRWLSARTARRTDEAHRHTLGAAHERLGELVAAIDAAAELLSPRDAAALWSDLAGIAGALERAGYPDPARVIPAPPAPARPRVDLFDEVIPRSRRRHSSS